MLLNESKSSRITGAHGGFVSIQLNAGASQVVNPGRLGAILSASEPMGTITIKRGHKMQSGFSLDESIERYYDIEFANNKLDHVAVRFNYFDVELNGQNEQAIKVYQSQDRGIHWKLQGKAFQNAAADIELKEKANAISRWTLATPDALTNRKSLPSTAVLRTWPNPAGSYFYVQVEGAVDDAQLQIFDVNGKLHRSSRLKQGTALKIEGLSPGVYIIKAEGNNLNRSNRVIVQDKGSNEIPNLLKTPSKKL
jgi:Secretion system C-terminal sorting domain